MCQSAGGPGGIRGYGSSHVVTTGGDVGVVSLGVGSRGSDEGDGKSGGRGGIQLVNRIIVCKKLGL